MSDTSAIEWTQKTWNPVLGCTKVGPGCEHCYAERMSARQAGMATARLARNEDPKGHGHYLPVVEDGQWTGHINLLSDRLDDPYRWTKSSLVFVNSMSDLFHRDVPNDFITSVFKVMKDCPRHTFQVLTKRPHRAAKLSDRLTWTDNIQMGTSIETSRYVPRISQLLKTDARVKFLSIEPLLGPIPDLPLDGIDWVIVGGESGSGARPMEAAWVRSIRDRCISRDVPFFFKQWGKIANNPDANDVTAKINGGTAKGGRLLDGRTWDEMP